MEIKKMKKIYKINKVEIVMDEKLVMDVLTSYRKQKVDIIREAFRKFKDIRGDKDCSKREFYDLFDTYVDDTDIRFQISYIIEHSIDDNVTTIQGDILNAKDEVIVKKVNCLCIKPHGLSKTIADKYSYANVYGQRRQLGKRNLSIKEDRGTPGNIVISKDPQNKGPIVVSLYGQYDYGKPGKSFRTAIDKDNHQLREEWFKQALEKLKMWINDNDIISIGFPYMIGCGMGGGNWDNYYQMILNFAKNQVFDVTIYKL